MLKLDKINKCLGYRLDLSLSDRFAGSQAFAPISFLFWQLYYLISPILTVIWVWETLLTKQVEVIRVINFFWYSVSVVITYFGHPTTTTYIIQYRLPWLDSVYAYLMCLLFASAFGTLCTRTHLVTVRLFSSPRSMWVWWFWQIHKLNYYYYISFDDTFLGSCYDAIAENYLKIAHSTNWRIAARPHQLFIIEWILSRTSAHFSPL